MAVRARWRHQGRNAIDQLQRREAQLVQLGTTLVTRRLAVLSGPALHQGDALFAARRLARLHFAGACVARNPNAMTGVSVVGLLTVAIGAMHGMPQHVLRNGMQAVQLMALAFAVNLGCQLVGFLLFWPLGTAYAMTSGLIKGNRNVTLVWVVVAP